MRTKLSVTFFIVVLATALLFTQSTKAQEPPSYLNAVVGTGSPESCTEAKFDEALAAVTAVGDGAISFNCGGPATIAFTSQKTIYTQLLVIDGGGEITISGGNDTRLFEMLFGTLELRNITLTNGFSNGHGGAILAQNNTSIFVINSTIQYSHAANKSAGGAITSFDTVSRPAVQIENSTIQYNFAGYGAINTVGRLLVYDSTIRENRGTVVGGGFSVGGETEIYNSDILYNEATGSGGGLFATSTAAVTINGGTFKGNKGSVGGAIYNANSIIMADVTIQDNIALQSAGGGFYQINGGALLSGVLFSGNTAGNGGGAIHVQGGGLSLNNSTLSGNDIRVQTGALGGGAVSNFEGSVSFSNSTLVDNVGVAREAVYFGGSKGQLSFYNTIMASQGGDNCGGLPSVSISYSLFDDDSCKSNAGIGNIVGPPLLEDLADNGGPTLTHMIASGSPAIDAGDCAFETDQRGVPRPQGAGCDIGAVERQTTFSTYLPMVQD